MNTNPDKVRLAIAIRNTQPRLIFDRRGGYKGGVKKPGAFDWSKPKADRFTTAEQDVRIPYLTDFPGKVNTFRAIIAESGAGYKDDDDDSLDPGHRYSVKSLAPMRDYVPNYPVRYQEYLKGNNGLQAL